MLPNFKKVETKHGELPQMTQAGGGLTSGGQPAGGTLASSLSAPPPAAAPPNLAASAPPTQQFAQRGAPSVIGPDLIITGNLSSQGQVQIDGEVQGDISASHVIVGERANIAGSIRANEVVVRGHVLGSVHGKRVMLQSQCHVEGDIFHTAISIEQGAYFEGKSRRSADPLSEGEPPTAPTSLKAKSGDVVLDTANQEMPFPADATS